MLPVKAGNPIGDKVILPIQQVDKSKVILGCGILAWRRLEIDNGSRSSKGENGGIVVSQINRGDNRYGTAAAVAANDERAQSTLTRGHTHIQLQQS